MPEARWGTFPSWEEVQQHFSSPDFSVKVELQHAKDQVWLRLEGALSAKNAEELGRRLKESLAQSKSRIVIDLKNLQWDKAPDLAPLREKLAQYRSRVRVILPKLATTHPELLLLVGTFELYKG